MHLVFKCALCLLAMTLSGCQSPGAAFSNAISQGLDWVTGDEVADPPHELEPIEPEVKISVLWDEDIGVGDGGNILALTVAHDSEGRVYAADAKGRVVALKLTTGEEIWDKDLDLPLSAGPSVGSNTVLLGTSEAQVVALDRSSGEILWQSRVSSEVLAPPEVAQGVVVVDTGDGEVFALAEADGRTLWSFGRHIAPLSMRGCGAPRILLKTETGSEDWVLAGFADGKMAALRLKDGKLIWEKQLAETKGMLELEQVVDIDSAPAIQDGTFYVSASYGGVIAASLLDGEVLWQRPVIAQASPAIAQYLFVTDVTGDVYALDETTGRAYWKQTALHQRQLSAPVPYGNWLVVGDYQGYVHFLAQEDGRLVGRVRIARSPIRATKVVGDVVLVLASSGSLAALKVEN